MKYLDETIRGQRGLWDQKFTKGGSSLCETQHHVNHLKNKIRAGLHNVCTLWDFTDNSVWSEIWRNGLSTAVHLFNFVLDLKYECQL
jgi:hypothetical protein